MRMDGQDPGRRGGAGRRLALSVLLVLSGLLSAAPGAATSPIGDRDLLFITRGDDPGLWLTSSAGGPAEHLVAGTVIFGGWSVAGDRLGYLVPSASGGTELHVVDADGSDRMVHSADGPSFPAWLADGSIVVGSYVDGQGRLAIVDPSGGVLEPEAPPGLSSTFISPSPDRSRIAVTWVDDPVSPTRGALSLLEGPGWDRRDLILGLVRDPTWSVDGTALVALHRPDPLDTAREELVVVDPADATWRVVATEAGPFHLRQGAWSGDGRRIVIPRWHDDDPVTALLSIRAAASGVDPTVGGPDVATLVADIGPDRAIVGPEVPPGGPMVFWVGDATDPRMTLRVDADGLTVHDLSGALAGGVPLARDPDGSELAIGGTSTLGAFDPSTGTLRTILEAAGPVTAASWRGIP